MAKSMCCTYKFVIQRLHVCSKATLSDRRLQCDSSCFTSILQFRSEQSTLPWDNKHFQEAMERTAFLFGCASPSSRSWSDPRSFAGSGATFYYTMTEDLSWISWRGRWARQRTLEYYLQEVGSQLLIHQLSTVSKSTIFSLADVSSAVIWRMYTCSAGS